MGLPFHWGIFPPRSWTQVSYFTGRFFTTSQDQWQSACSRGSPVSNILDEESTRKKRAACPPCSSAWRNSMNRNQTLRLGWYSSLLSKDQNEKLKKERKTRIFQRSAPPRKFKILLWCHFWLKFFCTSEFSSCTSALFSRIILFRGTLMLQQWSLEETTSYWFFSLVSWIYPVSYFKEWVAQHQGLPWWSGGWESTLPRQGTGPTPEQLTNQPSSGQPGPRAWLAVREPWWRLPTATEPAPICCGESGSTATQRPSANINKW